MTRSGGLLRRPVPLLFAQASMLGLTTAWVLIPATAIFLDTYGSRLLPVTYIGAAAAGALSSTVLASAFRRRPLAAVATTVLTGLSFALLVSWALLAALDATVVAFGLLVLVPLLVPVGFMFVIGQAGELLDVRTLKVLYARVIAGFALGYVVGGLGGPFLLEATNGAEHVLAAGAVAAGVFLVLVNRTRRCFPAELEVVHADEAGDGPRPTLGVLLRNRYVALIIGFQFLSAIESQWLDFLVFDRAAQRYTEGDDLARFISSFTAIAYGADIIFLLALAGFLLSRGGLRYGLSANPAAVLVLVAAVIVSSAMLGGGATSVFVLVVAARVTDLAFADGAARTSLGAAYQVVPDAWRHAAQATTEGMAVPVAIGLSGAVLLVLGATVGTGGLVLPVLTGIVVIAWLFVAQMLYRGYRTGLLDGLRRRALDPADLELDEVADLPVVERLLDSDEERDIQFGLAMLARAGHPGLGDHLVRLSTHRRPEVRTRALEQLTGLDVEAAAAVARGALADTDPAIRATAVRALGAAGAVADLPLVAVAWDDPVNEVRVEAARALLHLGDAGIRADLVEVIESLSRDADPVARVEAAQLLAACDPDELLERGALHRLLLDVDPEVANTALAAIRWPADHDRFDDVVSRLAERRTAAAAVEALARGGGEVLALIDEALTTGSDRRTLQLLVRSCRAIGGAEAIETLRRHSHHPDREVGFAVLAALASLAPSDGPAPNGASAASVVAADLAHASVLLRALVAVTDRPSADVLRIALEEQLLLLRRRAIADLATRYGSEGFDRVALQLSDGDSRSLALGLEWLDVTLAGPDRAVTVLLDPTLALADRYRALRARFPHEPATEAEVLRDLVEDPHGRWREPWLAACALHAASEEVPLLLDLSGAALDARAAIIHETLAELRARSAATDPADLSPPVARR